jgi:hypothetical protein
VNQFQHLKFDLHFPLMHRAKVPELMQAVTGNLGSETIQRNSQFGHVTMTIENKIKLTISTDVQTSANIYKLFQLAQ